MALVAVALVGVELRGHGPLATLVLPAAEAAGHRHDVGVAELCKRLGREGRPDAAGAVHDERRVVIGDLASIWDSRWPRGMCSAPGRAPCSYSSGSRTSSRTVPGRRRMSSAVAVSTSRISLLALANRSRKLDMVEKPTWWVGIALRPQSADSSPDQARHDLRQEVADRAPQHDVGEHVHLGGLGVQDDHVGAVALGDRAPRWPPGTPPRVVPTASRTSASSATVKARSMTSGTSDWPKEIVADLRMPPHVRQGGSSSPASHAGERSLHRCGLTAAHARRRGASCRGPRSRGQDQCPPADGARRRSA